MENANSTSPSVPYTSFVSFTNLLDWLKDVGVPAQLDRSFWGAKYSGSAGSQLMIALRHLNLLEEETPLPRLEEIANAEEDDRKTMLAGILKETYPDVFSIDLQRATPRMLEDAFGEIGGGSPTRRKAISFFINACKFADIPLSSSVSKKARNRSAGTGVKPRREANSKQSRGNSEEVLESDKQKASSQTLNQSLRTLQLNSGGSLTLSLDVNLFDLNKPDRDFVMELVERVQEYETAIVEEEESNSDFV